MVTPNEVTWTLSMEERQLWGSDKDYEWHYNILYKGIEQLIPLGAIPLALLVYYNARIYSAIKRPPNIELQADDEIAIINREKRYTGDLSISTVVKRFFLELHNTVILRILINISSGFLNN